MNATNPASPIRILFIEDLEYETELAIAQLKRAGIACIPLRVESEPQLRDALAAFAPALILSDFSLPQFNGLDALRIAHEVVPDVPFIFVSGTIGEERAIDALLCGAVDYVLKSNLARLAPAVRRALEDARAKRERQLQQSQIARLDRILKMLSGVNSLVVRIRDRKELLRETCRLAVSVGGYAAAILCAKTPGAPAMQPFAWNGTDARVTESLRALIAADGAGPSTLIGSVIGSGEPLVCNDTARLKEGSKLREPVLQAGLRSLVALPLLVDNTAMAVLVLLARDTGAVGTEELRMLRELAGSLSFALQYMQKDTTVRFLAHFDPHTGLAKRSLFCERLSRLLGRCGRGSRIAVAVFDIERLSLINDSFGRRTGDLLLQHVADRLKRHFPQTEYIAHFGGGTFAVIDDIGAGALGAAAQGHAVAIFGEAFAIEQREIPVAVRSGFAIFPDHGKEAADLVQNAEVALRNARTSADRHLHYSPHEHSQMMSRLALEHRLRLALERRQFELYYQPKVDVITRRIKGVEALLRWNDPQSGLVSPAAFLPLLESSGMIVEVGDWVIRTAAADLQSWLHEGLPPVRVAVNVSPVQLRQPEFAPAFLGCLRDWASSAAGLDVEITEGALHEDCGAEIRKLHLLRSAGINIAIDDFGTGYSSLSRMASMPIDTLKIDRSFLLRIPAEATSRILVKTVIALARGFNLTTVAEGVETQEQLDFLWQVGCNQSQGYLHSQPVTAAKFAQLLRHGAGRMVLPAREGDDPAPASPDADNAQSGGSSSKP